MCLETLEVKMDKMEVVAMKEQRLVFLKKTLVDHGKITKIPLIFTVNPEFPLTKPTFYCHREIVGILNTVSFFIKIAKHRSKKAKYRIPKNRTTPRSADIVVETRAKNEFNNHKNEKLPSEIATSNAICRTIIWHIFMK